MRFAFSLRVALLALAFIPQSAHAIINGTPVRDASAYPFFVSLVRSDNGKHFCGGTLVGPRWVLTAAHCVSTGWAEPRLARDISVVVASYVKPTRLSAAVPVRAILIHPAYNQSPRDSDIALLELSTDATHGVFATPAATPLSSHELLTIIGLGKTLDLTYATVLQEMRLSTVSNEPCRVAYQEGRPPVIPITDAMLCIGEAFMSTAAEGRQDTCDGDSGGPAFVVEDGVVVQHGIVSFGHKECAERGFPTVYTAVSRFSEWIDACMTDQCESLFACWDMDRSRDCERDEDMDGDGACTSADCGIVACWNVDHDNECDSTEDLNGDGVCDDADCLL